MFQIGFDDAGAIVAEGRLDAAKAPQAQEFLDTVDGTCVLDLGKLEYVSSAGLGVLLRTHKRLMGAGSRLEARQRQQSYQRRIHVFRIRQDL